MGETADKSHRQRVTLSSLYALGRGQRKRFRRKRIEVRGCYSFRKLFRGFSTSSVLRCLLQKFVDLKADRNDIYLARP